MSTGVFWSFVGICRGYPLPITDVHETLGSERPTRLPLPKREQRFDAVEG
jgi:hypothetical protein